MTNIILLGIASLLTDFSSEMVLPILPFFIQSLGGTGLAIGLIFGIGDAVAALLRVGSGYLADRTKRYKGIVLFGYAFSSVVKFAYVSAVSWTQVAWVRPAERIGKGLRDAPRDAIVSESVDASQRGRAFGVQRAMDSAGALLGSVAILVLFVGLAIPFRTIFLLSALTGLLAVVPLVFVRVPDTLRLARREVSFSKLTPKARRFIAIATLFALANFSVVFFIMMGQASLNGYSAQTALAMTLVAYIVFNFVDAVLSTPAGMLSDHIGRRRTIVIGYLMFSVVCLGFWAKAVVFKTQPGSFVVLIALFALYGVFKAFIDASQRAFVSDLSPDEVRGTALGTFETLTGLAAIPAGLMAGWLWNINNAYSFFYGAVVSSVAAVLLMIALRRR
ncbi:MAG: MFS transporter [Patescibacteria group bacterium]